MVRLLSDNYCFSSYSEVIQVGVVTITSAPLEESS